MKHIKLYKDKDAFNADSENLVSPYLCMIESDYSFSVSKQSQPEIPEEPEEPEVVGNYIVATYNVDSIEEDVKIVDKMNLVKNVTLNINGEWEEKNLLDGGNFEFNEEGAHTMRIYLNEDYSDSSHLFESCDKLTTLDFSNVDMTKVTKLNGLILDACNLQSLTITGPINNTVETAGVLFDTCAAGVAKFYYDKNYTNDYQSLINEAKQFWGETNVIGI